MHTPHTLLKKSISATSLVLLIALVALPIIAFVILYQSAHNVASANTAAGFKAGNIMSDQVMRNKNTMSVNQIQQFLNAKGANCTSGNNCLKNYREGGESAAQIIHETGQRYNINPQVLIVLLQKEVGIVTMNNPEPWRYRTAAGYGCPDSTPGVCNTSYYGFTNQLKWAATMFDAILRNSPTWYAPYVVGANNILLHPHNNCGTQRVTIENRATAALYSYTPYVPNRAAINAGYGTGDRCSSYGNRNFFTYFTDWFGSTQGTPFFQIGGKGRVYMMGEGDTYYYVPNPATMRAFGHGTLTRTVSNFPQSTITGKVFKGSLPRVVRFEGNEIYHIDGGIRRHANSRELLAHYGFNIGDEARLPAALSSYFRNGGALSRVAHDTSDGRIYLLENGVRRHFTGPTAYNSGTPAYSSLRRIDFTPEFVRSLPYGAELYPHGLLIQATNSPRVYMTLNHHEKVHINSPALLTALGRTAGSVQRKPAAQVNSYRTVGNASVFVQLTDGRLRVLDSDRSVRTIQQRLVPNFNIPAGRIMKVDPSVINGYRSKEVMTPLLQAHGRNEVYLVEAGVKRHVTSPGVLTRLGYNARDVSRVSQHILNQFPTGQPVR